MKKFLTLTLSLAVIAALPAVAEVDPIEIESFAVQQAPIKQVYLLLITQSNVRGVKSSAHSTFPMPDINDGENYYSISTPFVRGENRTVWFGTYGAVIGYHGKLLSNSPAQFSNLLYLRWSAPVREWHGSAVAARGLPE